LMTDTGISVIWMSIFTIRLTGDAVKTCNIDFVVDRYPGQRPADRFDPRLIYTKEIPVRFSSPISIPVV
jgi:hypothetical protein